MLSPSHDGEGEGGAESGSIPDSGNCEDHCEDSENETRSALLGSTTFFRLELNVKSIAGLEISIVSNH